jgi:long-chain acyl-CoA synthetase
VTGFYDQRPWLKYYSPWVPPDIEIPNENMVQVFKRAVSRQSSRPAIYYFGSPLSYAEVDCWSDRLAAALQDMGLQKGDRVVFYMQNIPQFVIAQYAVWKAGGIVVPLNPMYKEKELEYFFQDSGAKILISLASSYEITAKSVVDRLNLGPVITTSGIDFLPPDEPLSKVLQEEKSRKYSETFDFVDLLKKYEGKKPQPVEISQQEAAYLTYTSGTTGPPKGALNTHENIVFNAMFYTIALQLSQPDVILGVAPLFHVTGQVAHLASATGRPQ